MSIRLKRAFAAPSPEDGYRVLVDLLWPRGRPRPRRASTPGPGNEPVTLVFASKDERHNNAVVLGQYLAMLG